MAHTINTLPKWAREVIQAYRKKVAEMEVEERYWKKRAQEAEDILRRIGYKGY